MTATQVFLRFVKSEYTNKDGTINAIFLKTWLNELRTNRISTYITYSNGKHIRMRKSKNFVDEFLYKRKVTLAGFINYFYDSTLLYYGGLITVYGCGRRTIALERLRSKWRKFLADNIYGDDAKKLWIISRKFDFKWKA